MNYLEFSFCIFLLVLALRMLGECMPSDDYKMRMKLNADGKKVYLCYVNLKPYLILRKEVADGQLPGGEFFPYRVHCRGVDGLSHLVTFQIKNIEIRGNEVLIFVHPDTEDIGFMLIADEWENYENDGTSIIDAGFIIPGGNSNVRMD